MLAAAVGGAAVAVAADRERTITITAPTEPKLLAALAVLRAECAARRAVLRQVTEITRYPGGVFVRVRPVDCRTPPAPSYRPRTVPPRRGPRPVVVVGIVGVVVLVLAAGVLAVVALGWVVGHWRPMLGVAVVVGLIALAIRSR